jgi:hypothetical protein
VPVEHKHDAYADHLRPQARAISSRKIKRDERGVLMPDTVDQEIVDVYGATIWIGMSVNQDWKKQSRQSDD